MYVQDTLREMRRDSGRFSADEVHAIDVALAALEEATTPIFTDDERNAMAALIASSGRARYLAADCLRAAGYRRRVVDDAMLNATGQALSDYRHLPPRERLRKALEAGITAS